MKTYLFISYTNFETGKLTGAHRRMLELIKYLAQNNRIIMVSERVPQLDDFKNIEYFYLGKKMKKLPAHIDGMLRICAVLRRIKKSIKYNYAIAFASVYANCYRRCGYKNIITLLREDTIEYQKAIHASSWKIKYYQLIEKRAVQASIKVIVQCQNDKKHLIQRNAKYCKDLTRKVYVQINNINTSWMSSNERHDNNKDEDGIVRIIFIGDFSNSRKGHAILLPAVYRLVNDGVKIKLFIVGDGVEKNEYERKYKNKAFVFLGRIDDVNNYLSRADINIVPSLIDSCPNTVLEGLSIGVATYGTNTGGIPDLLQKTDYLFNPDVESIYSFLKNIINDKKYVEDQTSQISLAQRLKFDWGRNIQNIIESSSSS